MPNLVKVTKRARTHDTSCWQRHSLCALSKIQRGIKRDRRVRNLLKEVLVVMWDGDPRRQKECTLCQDAKTLLEELTHAR